jgi:hypothetical protein
MPKTPAKTKRLVWRISTNAPLGEWVDPALPKAEQPSPDEPEVNTGGWVMSSFDLLVGADVTEHSGAKARELFDELSRSQRDDPTDPAT